MNSPSINRPVLSCCFESKSTLTAPPETHLFFPLLSDHVASSAVSWVASDDIKESAPCVLIVVEFLLQCRLHFKCMHKYQILQCPGPLKTYDSKISLISIVCYHYSTCSLFRQRNQNTIVNQLVDLTLLVAFLCHIVLKGYRNG